MMLTLPHTQPAQQRLPVGSMLKTSQKPVLLPGVMVFITAISAMMMISATATMVVTVIVKGWRAQLVAMS